MQLVTKWGKKKLFFFFFTCSAVVPWMLCCGRKPDGSCLGYRLDEDCIYPLENFTEKVVGKDWSYELQILYGDRKMILSGLTVTSKILDAPSGMEPIVPSDCSTYCVVCNAIFTCLQQSHGRCPSHKCSVETPAWIPIQHSTVSLSLLMQSFERLNGKSLYLEQCCQVKFQDLVLEKE